MRAGDRSEGRTFVRRAPSYLIAAFLAGAILFGGGGAEGPLNNGLILAASGIALLLLIAAHWHGSRPLGDEAALAVLLLLGLLLIGAAQLVPLPPSVWHGLPGRELAESALRLASAADQWRPLSLDPEATRRSMAAVLLPAAIMLAVLGSSRRETLLLLRTVIGCAFVSSVIGVLQVASHYPPVLSFYDWRSSSAAVGIFANPNHQAVFLLAAIISVGLAVRLARERASERGQPRRLDWTWLFVPFFAAMVLAADSRAGLLLLVLALPAALVAGLESQAPRIWAGALAGAVLLGLLILIIGPVDLGVFSDDIRAAIYPDVLFTLNQYWPWGSGLGTFVSAFAANENLDVAGRHFVNHAHSDFLEFVLETGVVGVLWLGLAAAAIVVRIVSIQLADRTRGGQSAANWTGCFILVLLALHGLVDYPLRICSIAAVGGLAVGLVFARPRNRAPDPTASSGRFRWGFAFASAVGLIFGVQVVRIYAAQAAVRAGDGGASMAVRPQNGSGLALAAEEQLARHRPAVARALARQAILQSPLSVRAVRVLAIAEDLDRRGGMQAWRVASAMGWRDPPTQYWAMQQALANGEYATAAIRADAFLRTAYRGLQGRIELVRLAAISNSFRTHFVPRLLRDPPWESAFFRVSSKVPERQLQGVRAVLQDLARSPSPPSIEDAGSTIRILIERKRHADAVALYRALLAAGATESMMKLDFDQPTDKYLNQKNPFAWSIRAKGRSITSVEQSGNRRVLVLGTDGREQYRPVRRYSALEPGTYRLGYGMRGPADSPEALGISIYCVDRAQPIAASPTAPLRSSGFERRQIDFAVPQQCPLLLLAFEAKPTGRSTQAEFTDLWLQAT